MVALPAGSFSMGAAPGEPGFIDREGPRHKVSVDAFAISKFEITFDEYALFATATKKKLPKDKSWGRGVRPVIYVSWNDAQAYVAWLSEESGAQYRLPSEAEWEYAARAGSAGLYWSGAKVQRGSKAMANCKECGNHWDDTQTAPVGSFPANPFGSHDMSGNLWEWTAGTRTTTMRQVTAAPGRMPPMAIARSVFFAVAAGLNFLISCGRQIVLR